MIYLLDTHVLWHHAANGDELSPLAATRLDGAMLHRLTIVSADQEMHDYAPNVGVSLLW